MEDKLKKLEERIETLEVDVAKLRDDNATSKQVIDKILELHIITVFRLREFIETDKHLMGCVCSLGMYARAAEINPTTEAGKEALHMVTEAVKEIGELISTQAEERVGTRPESIEELRTAFTKEQAELDAIVRKTSDMFDQLMAKDVSSKMQFGGDLPDIFGNGSSPKKPPSSGLSGSLFRR